MLRETILQLKSTESMVALSAYLSWNFSQLHGSDSLQLFFFVDEQIYVLYNVQSSVSGSAMCSLFVFYSSWFIILM